MNYLVGYKIWGAILFCLLGITFFIVSLFIKQKSEKSLAQTFLYPLFQSAFIIALSGLIFIVGYKISNYKNQNISMVQNKAIFSGMDFDKNYIENIITASDIANLKSAKDSLEATKIINHLYIKFKNNLGVTIGNDPEMNAFVFSTILSHISSPYGKSTENELIPLLKEDSLDCDNYLMLAIYIFETIVPNHTSEYEIVGFYGGAVGNHAQVFYKKGNEKVLCDPTYGFVANIKLGILLKGIKLSEDQLFVFSSPQSPIKSTISNAIEAVINGQYNPRDLLFYFENVHTFATYSKNFPSFEKMIDSFKSPGGSQMYKELTNSKKD